MDGPYIFVKGGYFESVYVTGNVKRKNWTIKKEKILLNDIAKHTFTCVANACPKSQDPYRFTFEISTPVQNASSLFEWQLPDKVLAISDIEGNFFALKNILLSSGVIDTNCNWTFGFNHLVILGDLIDRGSEVVACLWLIFKLDNQSTLHGGSVHYILGNHEVMNFSRDFRYVNQKYFSVPPGMGWEYVDLFSQSSFLAGWIRKKNSIEKIGGYLFVHAGISEKLLQEQLPIPQVNNIVRKNIDRRLEEIGNRSEKIVMDEEGPLWYRGYIDNRHTHSIKTTKLINAVLNYYKANKIVIGHSLVPFIKSLYEKKLIAIDVNDALTARQESIMALMIEPNREYIVDEMGVEYRLHE
jgi:hypothetical protein